MKTNILILAIMIVSSVISGQGVSIGDKAPLIRAKADDGSTWDMKDVIGKDNIVLYFFPGALTTGCTKQACAYRDHKEDLQSVNAIVVGVSGDSPENMKIFKMTENLNFPLLSDEKGDIARLYGVPVGEGGSVKRTVEGKEYELSRDISIKRWTFIIDKEGKIIYKNESVNPEKDTQEVIDFLSNR
jgi:peroxiredoxin Q/BCP